MAKRPRRGGRRGGPAQGRNRSAKPAGQARLSQVVSTYGPGAMVDLVDHAVLVSGLDAWRHHGAGVIVESRLRDRLRSRGLDLGQVAFRLPPAGDDDQPDPNCGIPVVEFPRWFVCQQCKALTHRYNLQLSKSGRYEHACVGRKSGSCVPVRFVGVCRNGHLQDFPWVAFAHGTAPSCAAPALALYEGKTGDFSEIIVHCVCGARRRLASALVQQQNPFCGGERPWLGDHARQSCDEHLRLLVRTASNGYFTQVVSALSVPDHAQQLRDAVASVIDVVATASAETLPVFRQIPKVSQALGCFADDAVLAAIAALKEGSLSAPREPLRVAELRQFSAAPAEKPGELAPHDAAFFIREQRPQRPLRHIRRIVLAHKLREVRALLGFTRLEAPSAELGGEYDLGVHTAALSIAADWLPAHEVHGEGLFVELDLEAVRRWESAKAVKRREQQLHQGYRAWWEQHPYAAEDPPPVRFYLLHSLSHLLISAIALDCGYAASAICERIYCRRPQAGGDGPADPAEPGRARDGRDPAFHRHRRQRRHPRRPRRAGPAPAAPPRARLGPGAPLRSRSRLRGPQPGRRSGRALPRRRRLSRLPLYRRTLVRALQPLSRPHPRRPHDRHRQRRASVFHHPPCRRLMAQRLGRAAVRRRLGRREPVYAFNGCAAAAALVGVGSIGNAQLPSAAAGRKQSSGPEGHRKTR
jgi:hypothetical protein